MNQTSPADFGNCLEQQQPRITTAKKPNGLQCWYCKKHKSLRLCAEGSPLHEAYTAALHRRNQMGPLDHNNPEQYDAWLAMNRALMAYWGHQFEAPIDDKDEQSK